MDVLVAEARVIKRRIAQGAWKRACLAPKVCALDSPSLTCQAYSGVLMFHHGRWGCELATPVSDNLRDSDDARHLQDARSMLLESCRVTSTQAVPRQNHSGYGRALATGS